MALLESFTAQGNELVAVIGYAIIYLSLIWFGGSVIKALVLAKRNSE